jgi:hypothetical protein
MVVEIIIYKMNNYKKLALIILMLFSGVLISNANSLEDFDPLVDVEVTVEIDTIRALDVIDLDSDPDFFVKIYINNVEFVSPIFNNSRNLYNLNWSSTVDVPDDIEKVSVRIQLWDYDANCNSICDLSGDEENSEVFLNYSIKTGFWIGDDQHYDPSGYGRLNGCDDGSIYENQRDCELWFNIYQNDFDNDAIPYWTEVNVFGTDPTVDNTGEDADDDDVPIEWEHRWGYNPNNWNDHKHIDFDFDGIDNYEEYLTSQWGSDPFRRDLFLELDQMEEGPNGEDSTIPPGSLELLRTPYSRRNIVHHLDDGCMGGGGELIPFDNKTYPLELKKIYYSYFLHDDNDNWRRDVFRYCISIYNHYSAPGLAFLGEKAFLNYWHIKGINTFQISNKQLSTRAYNQPQETIDHIYACAIMHETAHTFGIDYLFPPGCDNKRTLYPWRLSYWLFGNYKSCMNYRYTFTILDYSNGSHGFGDYDDWGNLDFTFFQLKN